MNLENLTSVQLQTLKRRINALLEVRRKEQIAEVFNEAVALARKSGFELADLGIVPARKKRGRPPGKAKKLTKLKKSAAKKIRKPVRGRMAA